MLVLSRATGQSIMIGDDIEVFVVAVRGDKVRLGIAAPRQVPVHRKEIHEIVRREKAEAAQESEGESKHKGNDNPKDK